MDQKHKVNPSNYRDGISALRGYIKYNFSAYITRDDNCRSFIENVPRDVLVQVLDYIERENNNHYMVNNSGRKGFFKSNFGDNDIIKRTSVTELNSSVVS